MPSYHWDVFVAGEDLPRELETDYLLAEGDAIDVGGRWLVESVELDDGEPDDGEAARRGRVTVAPPHDLL